MHVHTHISTHTHTHTHTANLNKDPDIVSIAPLLPRAPDHIDLSLFPGYKASSTKSLVTHSTTLDKQSAKTISSCVHKEIPFVELKVCI